MVENMQLPTERSIDTRLMGLSGFVFETADKIRDELIAFPNAN